MKVFIIFHYELVEVVVVVAQVVVLRDLSKLRERYGFVSARLSMFFAVRLATSQY